MRASAKRCAAIKPATDAPITITGAHESVTWWLPGGCGGSADRTVGMLPPIPHDVVTPKRTTPEMGVCDGGLGSRHRHPLAALGIEWRPTDQPYARVTALVNVLLRLV